jgi:glycosyltransferase involved in cell wall biosynthesis
MKILFISRAYPPVTGGIENQNYALSIWLGRFAASVTTLANHHGRKALPLFLPYALCRALFMMRKYDVLLLGDGVLSLLGYCVKFFYPKKTVVSIIHGLDINYDSASLGIWYEKILIALYRTFWIKRFLPSLDGFIAVSKETRAAAIAKNIPAEKIIVIPNGIDTATLRGNYARTDAERLLDENLSGKQVLLTTGRLARRKGAAWFIREVLPQLPASVLYVLAGTGAEKENIRAAIRETGAENRVKMLGRVTDEDRNLLLNTADIFIQPNIRVPGDMEGFGIAVIEAAACGRPVIASDLEGLKDAVCQNENGILVEPENPQAFRSAILSLIGNESERLALGSRAAHYTETHYHWNVVARLYIEALDTFVKKAN